METADNDFPLSDVRIKPETYLEETISIQGLEVQRIHIPGQVRMETTTLKFIPYWSWGNRGEGDVKVWIKQLE
jgi:DUF1680 family protein